MGSGNDADDQARPLVGPVRRRITLLDVMILVVASAFEFSMIVSLWKEGGRAPTVWELAYSIYYFGLIAATPAVLVLNLIRPRPTVAQLCRQAGFAASLVGSVILAHGFLLLGLIGLIRTFKAPSPGAGATGYVLALMWWANLINDFASQISPAIIATWILLALGKRRSAGQGWPEAAGILLGIGWIVMWLIIVSARYSRYVA